MSITINFDKDCNDMSLIFSELKPVEVFQISAYSNTGVAERAIDGDEDTNMHTNSHTNPWWCADMGAIYQIKTVFITNRKEGSAGSLARSTNLRVGVTNTRPVVGQILALDAYTLCGEKPGLMGTVGIVSCPEGVTGQYVIVQFKVTNYMNIAEVKIYGFKDQL